MDGYEPLTDPASLKDRPCMVTDGANYARAFWNGRMWAYWDGATVLQIDFEPTHYRFLS